MNRFIKIRGLNHWLLYADSSTTYSRELIKCSQFKFNLLIRIYGIILFKRNGEHIVYGKQLIFRAILNDGFPKHGGAFEKGTVPFNKGLKRDEYLTPEQIEVMKKTQFTSENTGEKNASWRGGITQPNTDCALINVGANKRIRRPKLVYETYIGEEVPKRNVILHLNGEIYDDTPDNLLAITRCDLLFLNNPKHPMTVSDLISKYAVVEEIIK